MSLSCIARVRMPAELTPAINQSINIIQIISLKYAYLPLSVRKGLGTFGSPGPPVVPPALLNLAAQPTTHAHHARHDKAMRYYMSHKAAVNDSHDRQHLTNTKHINHAHCTTVRKHIHVIYGPRWRCRHYEYCIRNTGLHGTKGMQKEHCSQQP